MKRLLLITIASLAIMSCGNRGSQDNSSTSIPELTDSSAVKTLESFLNIDYEKAFAESDSTSEQYPDFSSDFFSVDTDNREPIIIFVSVPDCSACIASTLDFITTYSHADTTHYMSRKKAPDTRDIRGIDIFYGRTPTLQVPQALRAGVSSSGVPGEEPLRPC